MLGRELLDPEDLEGGEGNRHPPSKALQGLDLLPIQTSFGSRKQLARRQVGMRWPAGPALELEGFELHHGRSRWLEDGGTEAEALLSDDQDLGWWRATPQGGVVAGTYLHGIFESGAWRRRWLNELRRRRGLQVLPELNENHAAQRNRLLERLADSFERHVDLEPLLRRDG
jgi:adenosylcobyric acid synthase